jgi:23S rRNA pseudouridine1911/1915/1917 synthase
LVFRVAPASAGVRLDRLLGTMPGVGSRSQAKQLVDAGRVHVDGAVRKAGHVVRSGETVEVTLPPPEPTTLEPEPLPLVLLYEDDDLIALDKPPGIVVHPAPGARRGTVVNALVHRFGTLTGLAPERPGIVHRLDRDTSGVLLVARTHQALEGLARQFRERTLHKRYLAIVYGRLEPRAGLIDRPVGRHPQERKRMSVHSRRGRTARTRWEVVERLPGATLVRLFPETGRTHQLRVHLAALGHAVVGDRLYAPRRSSASFGAPRQALHAEQIGFAHPRTGAAMVIRSPLPPDLENLLHRLRQASGKPAKTLRSP